jgi:hypothetical protein
MRKRLGPEPDESGTLPNARPIVDDEPEPAAEDVFARFVQRSYARKEGRPSTIDAPLAAPPAPAPTPEADAMWVRSVEELLPHDDGDEDRERDTDPPPPPPPPSSDAVDADSTLRVVLLTQKKTLPPGTRAPSVAPDPSDDDDDDREEGTAVADSGRLRAYIHASKQTALPDESRSRREPSQRHAVPTEPAPASERPEWSSVVPPPSEATQRREAKKLVPDLAHRKAKPKPPSEASEDGLIPSGVLDQKLSDMAVLLRYGHEAQAARELEQLRRSFPQDLLLLRRIGEFWAESGRTERALEILFALASGLFERRNVEGMRQALEQARALDPHSERASRLLSLLDARPGTDE